MPGDPYTHHATGLALLPRRLPVSPKLEGRRDSPAILSRSATLDHVIPWAAGGTNELDNLVCACRVCNRVKGELTLEQLEWELQPIPDSDWDGLTRYYRPLWELAGQPSVADHPFWVRLFG